MAGDQFGHLLGAHEHALDLGRLVGAAHPALDPHVGAPAGALPGSTADRSPVAKRISG
jgi:hypothetical protein